MAHGNQLLECASSESSVWYYVPSARSVMCDSRIPYTHVARGRAPWPLSRPRTRQRWSGSNIIPRSGAQHAIQRSTNGATTAALEPTSVQGHRHCIRHRQLSDMEHSAPKAPAISSGAAAQRLPVRPDQVCAFAIHPRIHFGSKGAQSCAVLATHRTNHQQPTAPFPHVAFGGTLYGLKPCFHLGLD